MKDTDGLNDILGYARLVEGKQHSKHLSKVYLESVKTSKVLRPSTRRTTRTGNSREVPNNDSIQNKDLNPGTKRVVITVGLDTHLSIALHLARSAIIVRKRTIFPTCVEVGNAARAVIAIDPNLKIQDSVTRTIMS